LTSLINFDILFIDPLPSWTGCWFLPWQPVFFIGGIMKTKTILLIGDIDTEAYLEFVQKLVEVENSKAQNVTIELTSDGGHALVAFAFYDRMLASRLNITVIGRGNIDSAAVLILAAGDKRVMSRNASCLLHEEQYPEVGGPFHVMKSLLAEHQVIEDKWNQTLADRSNLAPDQWAVINKKSMRLWADQCLQYGLIDEVIGE
jgi:ATP-dependent Clp protease protease subunit